MIRKLEAGFESTLQRVLSLWPRRTDLSPTASSKLSVALDDELTIVLRDRTLRDPNGTLP